MSNRWLRIATAVLVFFILLLPEIWAGQYVWFGILWSAEAVGLIPESSGGGVLILGRSFAQPGGALLYVLYAVLLLVVFLPPLLLSLWVHHRVSPSVAADGHTRCGKCGYILKGLTEPRCPECGERL